MQTKPSLASFWNHISKPHAPQKLLLRVVRLERHDLLLLVLDLVQVPYPPLRIAQAGDNLLLGLRECEYSSAALHRASKAIVNTMYCMVRIGATP
ncbi:hypothetical protein [Ralstonia phage RPZH6]|nr:hypothetical protein [Ralstonia phage RPZH6]